jgi:hypothetical protein
MSDKRDNELGIVPGSQFGNMSSAEAAPGVETEVVGVGAQGSWGSMVFSEVGVGRCTPRHH